MANFTPQPISVDITPTTKFSEYRNKIQQSMDAFGDNINAELAEMFGQLDTTTTYTKLQQDIRASSLSKSAFNAIARDNRDRYAGSGHILLDSALTSVNIGISTGLTSNTFIQGNSTFNINGSIEKYLSQNVLLPQAPTVFPYNTWDSVANPNPTAGTDAWLIKNGFAIQHADASNSGLIKNGKFDTDTSGWTLAGTGTTLTQNAGQATLTVVTGGYGASQSIPTVVGKKYIFEADFISETGSGSIYVAQINGTKYTDTNFVAPGHYSAEFTATEASVHVWVANSTNGGTTVFDNIAVFPADAISRSDLVFLESWHEDVSEKDFVCPLGNTQYLGGVTDGMSAIVNGSFAGYDTFSLFGNWQAPSALIGKGYVWSSMTDAQKKAFMSNPENNCYYDGDKVIQVRYRVRVIQGLGDKWANIDPQISTTCYYSASSNRIKPKGKQVSINSELNSYNVDNYGWYVGVPSSELSFTTENGVRYGIFQAINSNSINGTSYVAKGGWFGYEGKCYFLPIALVGRRNRGIATIQSGFNPNGTKLLASGLKEYTDTTAINSIADCFDASKALTASGYIGTTSGRPDGLFYDQIHESDIIDLRTSAHKVQDYNILISKELNKAIAGLTRGEEGEWKMSKIVPPSSLTATNNVFINAEDKEQFRVGDVIQFSHNGQHRRGVVLSYADAGGGNWYVTYAGDSYNIDTTNDLYYSCKSTRKKSNTLLHCDIIGNPANYPASWKQSGVSGVPLLVNEDGSSALPNGSNTTWKLSKKANGNPLLVLKSTDNGTTWTALSLTAHYTINTTANTITFVTAPATNDLIRVEYQTHTSMAEPTANAEVLEIGDSWLVQNYVTSPEYGVSLASSLISKVNTSNGTNGGSLGKPTKYSLGRYSFDLITSIDSKPEHEAPSFYLSSTSPAVKFFPYLTRSNGRAYLNLVFKEMKYDTNSDTANDIVWASITESTNLDSQYSTNKYLHVTDGRFIGYWIMTADLGSVTLSNSVFFEADGLLYYNTSGSASCAKRWDGNGWGDDNKFNIVDNVSTTVDDNGNTVLVGQKKIALPYFIGDSE